MELHGWLGRIGYRPYFSGIGINADCPNLLIQRHVNETVVRAREDTGRKIHLIGHSLGGVIARSIAGGRPDDIASVITLASPIRGTVANRSVIHAADAIRLRILQEHGNSVLPHCYTGRCTCNFVDSLRRDVPGSMLQTAIYTRDDGIVDWRYCMTRNPEMDFEVAFFPTSLAADHFQYGPGICLQCFDRFAATFQTDDRSRQAVVCNFETARAIGLSIRKTMQARPSAIDRSF
jgi:pimeloyl-ACP methyl ester carboxylesterase